MPAARSWRAIPPPTKSSVLSGGSKRRRASANLGKGGFPRRRWPTAPVRCAEPFSNGSWSRPAKIAFCTRSRLMICERFARRSSNAARRRRPSMSATSSNRFTALRFCTGRRLPTRPTKSGRRRSPPLLQRIDRYLRLRYASCSSSLNMWPRFRRSDLGCVCSCSPWCARASCRTQPGTRWISKMPSGASPKNG